MKTVQACYFSLYANHNTSAPEEEAKSIPDERKLMESCECVEY